MATPTSPAKVCAICKQDCTSKPRVKDAQGHYFCKECVEKKKAAKAGGSNGAGAAKASPKTIPLADDDRGMMARLVDDSVSKSGNVCPGCRRPLKADAVICTQCGFNRETSRVITTQVQQAKESSEAAAKALALASAGTAPIFAAIGAAIGGAIGAAIWAGVAYTMHVEISYIAILVGILAGGGAMLGARQHAGILTGGIAAIAAVASILLAKFVFVQMILGDLGISGVSAEESIIASMSLIDIIFFGVAIVAAAGVGSGGQISFGGD